MRFWQGFAIGFATCATLFLGWYASWAIGRRKRQFREVVQISLAQAQQGFTIPPRSAVAVPVPPELGEYLDQLKAEGHTITFDQKPSINFNGERLIECFVYSDGEEVAVLEMTAGSPKKGA